jgi:hypothetical protein
MHSSFGTIPDVIDSKENKIQYRSDLSWIFWETHDELVIAIDKLALKKNL